MYYTYLRRSRGSRYVVSNASNPPSPVPCTIMMGEACCWRAIATTRIHLCVAGNRLKKLGYPYFRKTIYDAGGPCRLMVGFRSAEQPLFEKLRMVQQTLVAVSLGIRRAFGPPRRNMLELNPCGERLNTAVVCVFGSRSKPALDATR